MIVETPANVRLRERIEVLKAELNAAVMVHNYQRPEVQDVADVLGDSLEMAREATRLDAEVLVVCGVLFMAESAAILNPGRTVLLSEGTAGCPMADMITVEDLRRWKQRYPEALVVCYVNSSAAVKAESDYCCTSANAVAVVEAAPSEEILFVPDQNLGSFVAGKTGKRVIVYPGYCNTHHRVRAQHIRRAKEEHPQAVVLVHPECRPEVTALADEVLSTSQMAAFVAASEARAFLIGTEEGLVYRLQKDNPEKAFYVVSASLVCPDMKMTTMEEVVRTMELRRNVVAVAEETRVKAKVALDRMLAIT